MKSAVIYARFSSSGQREASIDDQVRVCTEWCKSNGYRVVKSYCDYAISGRTDDRPQFQEMILNAPESDIVLVYMMDRFSRDIYDAPIYKKKLRDKGVKVMSATEAMPDGPEAILMESLYEAMAAMESAHISRRVKRGMEGNARKCLHNGVSVFGYDFTEDGYYRVNEAEADLVREAFARRREGESFNSIGNDFARRGVVTSHHHPCRGQMIQKMLKNEKYIGVYKFGDVRVEGGVPAIVSTEDFMAVQGMRGHNGPHAGHHDYALSGRAFCAECGHRLNGTTASGKGGVRYHYYRCPYGHTGYLRSSVLEGVISGRLREMLSTREVAEDVARTFADYASDGDAALRLDIARKSLESATRGLENLSRAVEEGMPYSEVRDRMDGLRAQRSRAEADVRVWEQRVTVDVDDFVGFLQTGLDLTDRDLLDAFVARVTVGDEIEVTLSYGETVRFAHEYSAIAKHWFREPHTGTSMAYCNGMVVVRFGR